ncbi:MAG: PpiC-type peptidyl-prolyl cis-trans [Geobacteraceae bacterium]|nr:MAG: PpiC-type peptidyl-prolyl cis-trans [Geobacteraceae bacterium]
MHVTIQQMRKTLLRSLSTVRALLPWSILFVLLVGVAPPLCPYRAWGAEPEIVARVNGEPVTLGELQRMLADPLAQNRLEREHGVQDPDSKELERLALRKLINRHLLLQEAGRRNLTVTEQELDQAITALRRRFKDLKEFGEWMKERGVDDRSLFDTVRTEMLLTRIRAALVKDVRLAEEQVNEYYEALKEELKTAGDVRLRIIAVKEKAEAEDIMAALRKGGDFADLARKRSLGLRTAQGGDTGWVNPQSLPPPLLEAVGNLKAGEAGGPLRRGNEFLIVGLAGRRPERTKSLAEARPEIERRLLAAKQQEAVQAWLKEQEKKSKIEVFLQAFSFPPI